MSLQRGPKSIVTDGLVYGVDPFNTKSYPGSGNIINSLKDDGKIGTLANGTTFTGNSFNLDGIDDYIQYKPLQGNSLAITYSIWIKSNNNSQTFRTFWNTGGFSITPLSFFYHPGITNISLHSNTGIGSRNAFNKSYVSYPITEWQQFSFTINEIDLRLYYNGVFLGSQTRTSGGSIPVNTFNIGVTMGYGYFNGETSQSLLYNRTLSSAEVLQNYNALKGRFGLWAEE